MRTSARRSWFVAIVLAAGCSALAGRNAPPSVPTSAPPASALPEPEMIAPVLDGPPREPASPFAGIIDLRCDTFEWEAGERSAFGVVRLGSVADTALRRARRGRLVVRFHWKLDSSLITAQRGLIATPAGARAAQGRVATDVAERGNPEFLALDLESGEHQVRTRCLTCWPHRFSHRIRRGFIDTVAAYHGRATRQCDPAAP